MPLISPQAAFATVGTFLGALVRSFNTSVGWNTGGGSQLTVQLVDDPIIGAVFNPPAVGTPVYFSFYGFQFNGLFQKWEQQRGQDGNPVYEVTVSDPKEILDGVQVIMGGYNGTVVGIRNVLNPFGFWEQNGGFGAALVNDGGMPWFRVRDGILAIANSPAQGLFGGPLTLRGFQYGLDLSELPQPPAYYRVGGGASASLLEIIAQVCEDGGCDFFVELHGYTIVVRVVSRSAQPPLGTISAIANTNYGGTVNRSSNGVELRNELTGAFLIGGEFAELFLTDAITQFWGYDISGNAIVGQQLDYNFFDKNGHLIQVVPTEVMNLNASPVSDVIGDVSYVCTTLEMRFAQVSQDSWEVFMQHQRPDAAAVIGITSPFRNNALPQAAAMRPDLVNDDAAAAQAIAEDIHGRVSRMYEFVRGTADEFLGKKFLVFLPFLFVSEDPETLKIRTSYEITDSAWVVEDGLEPLGLTEINADLFKTPDGRFKAFAAYTGLEGADLSKVSPQGSAVQGDNLYMDVSVNPQLVFTPTPSAVVTFNGPLVDDEATPFGDPVVWAAAIQENEQEGQKHLAQCPISLKVAPATRAPAALAIPLKSNIVTYGPWLAQGAYGKVRVEQDPSLVPWTYGSNEALELAAEARVGSTITNQQEVESGSITLAAPPTVSLGDALQANGPALTAITVDCGGDGVKTTYRWQTYTPRFGTMSKTFIERVKKVGLTTMELRRSLRTALKQGAAAAEVVGNAARTALAFRERQAKARKRETPLDVLHAWCPAESGNTVRCQVSAATMEEAVFMSNAAYPDAYPRTVVMSLQGLFRPFTTAAGSGVGMASYARPTTPSGLGLNELNPLRWDNDIEVHSWGDSYKGMHAYRRGADRNNSRLLGHRVPMILVGWGYAVDGSPVPGASGQFVENAGRRSDLWKAGPVDPLWDERRGVWTVHGTLKGTVNHVPAAGSGAFVVDVLGATGDPWSFPVWNYFSSAVGTSGASADSKVICNYVPTDNRWYVVAADCAA